ncbi:hypothetical protein [Halalkalicoccus salilacus]|uniref:hypothetical protein n=1 Tax=Halalkalicoccus salilacus TaxID=3117459 RepID=UPI00300F2261
MLFGTLLSWLGVLSEVIGYRRHERPLEIGRLLLYGVLESVSCRQWRTLVLRRHPSSSRGAAESSDAMERSGSIGSDGTSGPSLRWRVD